MSDESTVRRWEKERGLPIHRVPGRGGAKIFAYTEELHGWLAGRRGETAAAGNGSRVAQGPATDASGPDANWTVRRWTEIGLGAIVLVGALAVVLFFSGRLGRPQHPAMRSIAVLPLANLTGDSSQAYLAAGMTDELITELARISSLRVVSRTSVQQYARTTKPLPEIARELDVAAIVEGSVGRGRNGIRVNIQLLDARNDRHIWADVLERGMEDASSMQHELAEEIAHQVGVQLTPLEKQYFAGRHPIAPESFQDYLEGRYYWNKRTPDGLSKAENYFQDAAAKDPKNPLAFAGLADTYLLESLYSRAPSDELLRKAQDAASRAIALDDQLAEAHCSRAYVLFLRDWDFAGAEKEFRRALQLNPNFATAHQWYAEVLSVLGRHAEAIAQIRRAEELDPFSMIIHHEAGQILQNARQYAQALEEYAKAETIAPDFPQAHDSAALAWRRLGKFDSALKEMRSAAELSPNFLGPGAVDAIARAYARSGRRGFLLQSLALLRFYPHPAYSAALDYAELGDKDHAFAALEEAYRDHDLDVLSLKCSPELDALRGDPRYKDLAWRIGLAGRD
ncbi:MAG TPA: tetratricopeptide repeat protein [Rhizomicrobium sp.]|nr:tetratricopeptide repeat protein [Rhizomicrobium sp.]